MKINRNNYQLWIVDFYDGKLDEESRDQLLKFLSLNTDLKAEFDDFGDSALFPDISIRTDKKGLRKDLSHLSDDQKERFVIALIEEDLNEGQENEIRELVNEDEGFADHFKTYSRLKLVPGDQSFPGKRALKMIPLKNRVRRIAFASIPAAASVALIISLSVLLRSPVDNPVKINSGALSSLEKYIEPTGKGSSELEATLAKSKATLKITQSQIRPNTEVVADLVNTDEEREHLQITPLKGQMETPYLANPIAYNLETVTPLSITPIEEEGGLSPRQFVAQNFRTLALDEKDAGTERLKVYEVADAGIKGLNKLLGWEMELKKDISADGQLNGLKFTSQLINFDRKPKKSVD